MKRQYIKDLHSIGVRKANKFDGSLVSLYHLKTFELINLWYKLYKA